MGSLILVIEDNHDIRENTSELLSIAGYEVITAENGKTGLEAATKHHPDLILCDIMMPVLDGYGVLRAMDNIPSLKGTPFVYLTAKSEKSDFRTAMDLGADDYLTKPFTGDELIRVVGARIKKGQERRAKEEQPAAPPCDFNEAIAFNELSALSPNRSLKKFRAKDIVYMEGDSATHLAYVVSGAIKVYKTNESGREYITELVGPSRFFGHLALLGDGVHKHSAVAIENSEIMLIPRQNFLDILSANHSFAVRLLRFLSHGINESDNKLLQLAYNSARKRVAEALLFMYGQYRNEDDPDFALPVSRENLSAIAGISPESVSRNLSDFKEEKLIATDHGAIRIIDFKKLRRLKG